VRESFAALRVLHLECVRVWVCVGEGVWLVVLRARVTRVAGGSRH
jgi:hypothetical protein